MTCGEGGALVCCSREDAEWYRSARHHGISKNASDRYTKKYQHWDMEMMGWKYNMNDIQAALLMNQIDRLDKNHQKRRHLEFLYRERLQGIRGLHLIESPRDDEISGHHLFTVLLPKGFSRDQVLLKLQEKGIGCAVNHRAIHALSYFKGTFGYKPDDFPVANEMGNRTISLPLYAKIENKDVEKICDALIKEIT
jgi:dTDP-4-amino-4,6-dideoxygalactose transaminase